MNAVFIDHCVGDAGFAAVVAQVKAVAKVAGVVDVVVQEEQVVGIAGVGGNRHVVGIKHLAIFYEQVVSAVDFDAVVSASNGEIAKDQVGAIVDIDDILVFLATVYYHPLLRHPFYQNRGLGCAFYVQGERFADRIDCLVDGLIDSSTDCVIDKLFDTIDKLTNRSTD